MAKKNAAFSFFHHCLWLLHTIVACALSAAYASTMLFFAAPVYAEATPGGNIANPVIHAVDIAKPAVVRIITTLDGRLTVFFPNNTTATFPQNGTQYQIETSGSGAFISSHGDILTADHVINAPHDASLDQFIQQEAAQEVADYVNQNLHFPVLWRSQDALNALNSGYFLSQAHYNTPTSKVYLSTDYTGPLQATNLQNLPPGIASKVDRVETDSPFDQKDLAIIHVNMDDTPSIPLGDSSNVAQQDELTIIGFPGNGDLSTKRDPTDILTSSLNKLYVSALKRTDRGTQVIQTGGNIEHGDSGGPALDSSGHIVGVVSFDQNTDFPEGTGFLQTSNNDNGLIGPLGLDLIPGNLEKQWSQAFSDYASTAPGHWHKTQTEFQHLSNTNPAFQAVQPFLTYTKTQASNEQLPEPKQSQINAGLIPGIVAICLAVLIMAIVLVLAVSANRRKRRQASIPSVLPQAAPAPQYTQPVQPAPASDILLPPPTTPWPAVPPQTPYPYVAIPPAAPWPPATNSMPGPRQPIPPQTPPSGYGTPPVSTTQQQPGVIPQQQHPPNQVPANTQSVQSAMHDEATIKRVTENFPAIKGTQNTLDEGSTVIREE